MASRRRNIINLPPEIILDILSRLRVRTLCRLRCVSKSWLALISDPAFIESHRHRSKQNPHLLLSFYCDPCNWFHFFSIQKVASAVEFMFMITPPRDERQPYQKLFTVATYLDLVCVYSSKRIYLCNPSTQQLVQLAGESPVQKLFFHQQFVGLGYISSTKTYKLFRIISPNMYYVNHGSDRYIQYEIFTVGTKHSCWKTVARPPHRVFIHQACVNGDIYLLPIHAPISIHNYTGAHRFIPRICCFDLEHEKWSEFPTPCQIHPKNVVRLCFMRQLVEERLCLADFGLTGVHQMELWFLTNRDTGSWVKEYIIDISSLSLGVSIMFGDWTKWVTPQAVEEDGRVLLCQKKSGGDELWYYDPKHKSFQELNVTGEKAKVFLNSFYFESFMSLIDAELVA